MEQSKLLDKNRRSSGGVTKTFAYDVENRLTEAKLGNQTINTNTYRADGQRITKTEGSNTIHYYYQDGSVWSTTDATGTKTSHNLLGASGQTIATKRYQDNYAGKYYFYNKDIRTSTSSVTDEDGAYVSSYTYSDFGETERTGDATFPNEISYTGGIYDTSTSLYYLNARYYDPSDARFTIMDTARNGGGVAASQSLYGYCEGDPINAIDPSGHKKAKSIYYLGKQYKGDNYYHGFLKQALNSKYYERKNTEMGPFRTKDGFIKEWNKTKNNITEMYIFVHSDASNIYFKDGKLSYWNLRSKLKQKKELKHVTIFGCKAGKKKARGVASAILTKTGKNGSVIARTSYVSFRKAKGKYYASGASIFRPANWINKKIGGKWRLFRKTGGKIAILS